MAEVIRPRPAEVADGGPPCERRWPPRGNVLVCAAVLLALAATTACTKNNMAYQASIRPWQSGEQPAEGAVPVTGLEPNPEDAQAVDAVENPVPSDPASIARGRALFADHCQPCHGPGGDGHGVLEKELGELVPLSELVTADVTDGYVYGVIRNGGLSMPAYGPDLTVRERWDLVNYLRTLGQQDDE